MSQNHFNDLLNKHPELEPLRKTKSVTSGKMDLHPAKFKLGAEDNQSITPQTYAQQELMAAIFSLKSLIVADGPAGVGKTFLLVLAALIHKELGLSKKIYLARPAVDEGESVGFVPGGMNQKLSNYMRPMLEVLVRLGRKDLVEKIEDMKNDGDSTVGQQIVAEIERDLEFVTLSQLMGRNLEDSFIIIDEGQLTDLGTMITALTRTAKGSRVCVAGDIMQARGKYTEDNGMEFAIHFAKTHKPAMPLSKNMRYLSDLYNGRSGSAPQLPDNDEAAYINFSDDEIVRHSLVKAVVKSARKYKAEKAKKGINHTDG